LGAAVFNRTSSWDATCCRRRVRWSSTSLSDCRAYYWQRTTLTGTPFTSKLRTGCHHLACSQSRWVLCGSLLSCAFMAPVLHALLLKHALPPYFLIWLKSRNSYSVIIFLFTKYIDHLL
jgi:hypothetical protein